jgi:predicted Rdx family selenoprotein
VANEFFRAYGPDAAISLTPGANGRFEVYLDGDKIYDKKEEDNVFPNLARIRELKQVIQAKLETLETASAD